MPSLPYPSRQRRKRGDKYSQRRPENIRSDIDGQKNGRNCRDSLVNIFSAEKSSQESRGFSHGRFKANNAGCHGTALSGITQYNFVVTRDVRKAHSFRCGMDSTNNVYVGIENIHIL